MYPAMSKFGLIQGTLARLLILILLLFRGSLASSLETSEVNEAVADGSYSSSDLSQRYAEHVASTSTLFRRDYTCGPGKPCANGACCGASGFCGYGKNHSDGITKRLR
jgi:hypothetical protein